MTKQQPIIKGEKGKTATGGWPGANEGAKRGSEEEKSRNRGRKRRAERIQSKVNENDTKRTFC